MANTAFTGEELLRAQAEMGDRLRRMQEQSILDALRGQAAHTTATEFDLRTMRPAEPRKPSRFDGPDVIDLVQGVDGAWCVPPVLEACVRAL